MRGLAAATILGAAYHVGWLAGAVHQQNAALAAAVAAGGLVGVSVAGAITTPMIVAGTAVLLCGLFVSDGARSMNELLRLVLAGVLLTVASRLFFGSYRFFQRHFAETVYSVYYARRRSPLTSPKK